MNCAAAHTEPAPAARRRETGTPVAQRITEMLERLHQTVPMQRRVMHAGEVLYRAGDTFDALHVLNAGMFKLVNVAADGRERVVGLHFRGDWLGFDGIAKSRHGCDAVAIDTSEVWSMRYSALLAAGARNPELLTLLHAAMSRELSRDRESLLSLSTLPVDARVAGFLRSWAGALAERGLRTDQITLRLSRAEIGNYLGMTLESVSRALSRMARASVIRFNEKGRRDIEIPALTALDAFIEGSAASALMH